MQRSLQMNKTYTILSFPSSGRHWLKEILTEYSTAPNKFNEISISAISKQFIGFGRSKKNVFPEIEYTHDVTRGKYQHDWRYDELEGIKDPELYNSDYTVMLMRDPRDIVVSWYYVKKNRDPWIYRLQEPEKKLNITKDIDEFVYDEIFGIKKIVAAYNLWVPVKYKFSYEDMNLDLQATITKLIQHFGVSVVEKDLKEAIEKVKFEKMKERESKLIERYPMHFPDRDFEMEHVRKWRKGIAGGYVDELRSDTIAWINEYLRENLNPIYERYYDEPGTKIHV